MRRAVVTTEARLNRRIRGRRLVLGCSLALALPPLITLMLAPLDPHVDIAAALLAFLIAVVVASTIGGLIPALLSALASTLLADYYFTAPYRTLSVTNVHNVVALAMFGLVGCTVGFIVHRSAALAAAASATRQEAEVLRSLSVGMLHRQDRVRGLLEQARDTFGMRSAALFDIRGVAVDSHGAALMVEAVGHQPPSSPESADFATQAGEGFVLALCGRPLSMREQGVLAAFAAHAAAMVEREQLAARAADANRLRASESVRTALLAAVSHDLRTPVAGIKASVSTLLDPELSLGPDDEMELLTSIDVEVERLTALIDNLLDMSRIQAGAVGPVIIPTTVDELVQRAVRFAPAGRVQEESPEDLPLIATDPGLIERVLANVIENAVQHSPATPGAVRIVAEASANEAGGHVDIRIVDHGPGVPLADQERIFQPFQRYTDRAGGIGLGLAVAKGLSEACGARIAARDSAGGGLTVIVSLPISSPSVCKPAAATKESAGEGL